MAASIQNPVPVAIIASATISFTSSVYTSSNLKDSLTQIPICDAATFFLDVTNNIANTNLGSNGTSSIVNVMIDTSPDNGTSWLPAYKFVQVTTSANQQRLDVRLDGLGLSEVGAISSLMLGTGTAASISYVASAISGNTVVTRDLRVRMLAGTGVTSFSCSLWGVFVPAGRHGF